MIKPSDVDLNCLQTLGNTTGRCLAIGANEWYEFINGKITTNLLGQRIEIVAVDNNYEKIFVKCANKDNLLSKEELEKEKQIPIILDGVVGRFWRDNAGNWQLSLKANSWRRDTKNVHTQAST